MKSNLEIYTLNARQKAGLFPIIMLVFFFGMWIGTVFLK